MMRASVLAVGLFAVMLPAAGCAEDDPTVTDLPDSGDGDRGGDGDGGGDGDDRDAGGDGDAACTPLESDYVPGADDAWDACISDDGEYHRIEDSISSTARVMAFEQIAELLFDPTRDPSPTDFFTGRMIYQTDEGLDSRVVRRYDPHYEVPDGTDCALQGVPAMHPDYCVGPAKLSPLIIGALDDGYLGDETPARAHAARAEAGLLWFLYVSHYKEATTCATKAKDCDSAYAYYTGGAGARGGIGLSRYVDEVDSYAHGRAWDGLLGLRCWRHLDDAETAADPAMGERARAQYDRAVLDGIAAIVRDRLVRLGESTGDERAYYWAFLRTLGPLLDREGQARSADAADALGAELTVADPAQVDVAAAIDAIDLLFDCP